MSDEIEEEENKSPLIEDNKNNIELEDNNKNQDLDVNKEKEIKNLNISKRTIEKIKSNTYIISRKIRWLIFFLFTIINLLMNFDHGTIPAATEQLRNYLNLNDSELGLFGSLVFVGVIIGSLISLTIINTFNRKYILMFCLILCGLSLFIFTKTTQYVLLCVDRVIIGVFQAFISIYLPLWCDQFGIESTKALMIALIQVAPPLGVLVGYIVTTLLNMYLNWLPYFGDIGKDERWLFSFYIQSFIIWGVSISLLFFSDNYFNSKARRVPIEIEETLNIIEGYKDENKRKLSFFYNGNQNFEELKENTDSPNNFEKNEIEDNNNSDTKQNEDNAYTINKLNNDKNIENNNDENDKKENTDNNKENELKEKNEKENEIQENNENDIENNEIKDNNESYSDNKNEDDIPFLTKLKLIFSEPLFILCVFVLSILFFIVTCVQYWASDYMLVALGVQDETQRLFGFSVVCLTSPTCGLIIGGFIVDKIGGYYKKNALIFCLIFSFLSTLPAIPLPFVNSLFLYAVFLWILLFLGAALIPPIQGIIIACLPKNVQGSGNSFVIFFYNLLGYLPAPFVYGFLKDYFDDKDDPKVGSRVAQRITIWTTFVLPIIIGIATFIRFRKDEEYNEKMGRDKTKKIEELNDDDAIRQRESSLALNVNEHIKIAEKVFNEEIKDENEDQKENNDNNLEMNIKDNNNKNEE